MCDIFFFFFKQKTAYDMRISDWSSDVCSSDLANAKGVEPLAPVLQSIDEAGSRAELAVVMGRLSRLGLGTPFGNFVDSDDKNPDAAIFQLVQGGLGLPDRDYYLSDDAGLVGQRNDSRDYLVQLLTLAGEPNQAATAAAILTLESDIAEAPWTQVAIRDAQKTRSE